MCPPPRHGHRLLTAAMCVLRAATGRELLALHAELAHAGASGPRPQHRRATDGGWPRRAAPGPHVPPASPSRVRPGTDGTCRRHCSRMRAPVICLDEEQAFRLVDGEPFVPSGSSAGSHCMAAAPDLLGYCCARIQRLVGVARQRGPKAQAPCLIGERGTGLRHIGPPVQLVRSSLHPARSPDEPRRIVARAHTPSGSPNHESAPRATQPVRSDPRK